MFFEIFISHILSCFSLKKRIFSYIVMYEDPFSLYGCPIEFLFAVEF